MVDKSQILQAVERQLTFEEGLARLPVLVDVRAEKEFRAGSVPGSVNIPLFDDDERHLVGTIYRQGGQAMAVNTGFELVTAKLDAFLALFEQWRGREVGVLCARGGMRSRSVVNLLVENGFSAWQLRGGYKGYRQVVLERLKNFSPQLIVLHGLTGTGKTRILDRLSPAIDLEGLARHQSSLFGGLNRRPRSQKNFDAYLYNQIGELADPPWFIEGESRKMGDIYLPERLAEAMDGGTLVLVTAPLDIRIERIVEDYPVEDEEAAAKIRAIFKKLSRHLGRERVETLCGLLEKRDLHELVRILLVDYYDKRYNNNLLTYHYQLMVDSSDIDQAARTLTDFRASLLPR